MKKLSDREVMEFLLAGKVFFAHKAVSADMLTLVEAADLLEMDTEYLLRLFEKLGLDKPNTEMIFDEFLEPAPRETFYIAEDTKKLFLSEDENDDG